MDINKFWEIPDCLYFPKDNHERKKEECSVDVVVQSEFPDVTVDDWQDFLGEDGVESYTSAGTDTEYDANHGQGT